MFEVESRPSVSARGDRSAREYDDFKHEHREPISEADVDDSNPVTPAGYTYFAQFIDHGITFKGVVTPR
jgi:hypothetical protein